MVPHIAQPGISISKEVMHIRSANQCPQMVSICIQTCSDPFISSQATVFDSRLVAHRSPRTLQHHKTGPKASCKTPLDLHMVVVRWELEVNTGCLGNSCSRARLQELQKQPAQLTVILGDSSLQLTDQGADTHVSRPNCSVTLCAVHEQTLTGSDQYIVIPPR